MEKVRQVFKSGNSLVISLPRRMCDRLAITQGSFIKLEYGIDKSLTLKKVNWEKDQDAIQK